MKQGKFISRLWFRLYYSNNNSFLQRFNDAIWKRELWTTNLGFSSIIRHYHINNVLQKNNKGYGIRIFTIRLPNPMEVSQLPKERVLAIGHSICEQINNIKSYYQSTLKLEEDNFFWGQGSVFQEVIGREEAFDELCYNHPPGAPDYYERNKETIRCFFREGTLTMEHAQHLGAPLEEVSPEFWPTDFIRVSQQELDEGNNNNNNVNNNGNANNNDNNDSNIDPLDEFMGID